MDVSAHTAPLVFRPEEFFLGRTEGGGVVRNPFGKVVRRCQVSTRGARMSAYGAISLEETFEYDDGEVDVWRWAISDAGQGAYIAAESQVGSGVIGRRSGEDYALSFRRPIGRARGLLTPRFDTRFTLLAPTLALKVTRVSLLGAPMGVLTAFHRRAEGG